MLIRNSLTKGKLIFLFACIATLVLLPLASNISVPNNLDYISHFIAISQAKLALTQGQFPLRFSPTYLDGWPYPLFQFYSPTSYTVAGWINKTISANPFVAYKITIWLALLLGAIYFYRTAKWLVKSKSAGVLASIVYLTAPYQLLIVNHLGSFNEAIALGIIPVVLFYTLQCYSSTRSLKNFLLTSFSWYLLATIHIVTFVNTSFFIAVLLVLVTLRNHYNLKNIFVVGFAYLFACLLAAWYLFPIALFSKYLNINRLFNSSDLFYAHSPSLIDLLALKASFSKGFFTSFGMHDIISQLHPAIGLPIILAVGVCFVMFYRKERIANGDKNTWLPCLLLLFLAAFILTWSPFNFWQWLPGSFRFMQFSSRLMGQLIWIGALLFAWAVSWWFNQSLSGKSLVITAGLVILSVSPWLFLKEEKFTNIPTLMNSLTSTDCYLINIDKYPRFVQLVDNILLRSSRLDQALTLDNMAPIVLQTDLLKSARDPYVSITGMGVSDARQSLVATLNDKVIAKQPFIRGPMKWAIPLKTKNLAQHETLKLGFNPNQDFTLHTIALGGFLNDAVIMKPNQVLPRCVLEKGEMICRVDVSSSVKLLELPMFYFPKFLSINVNGQKVPYLSVLYQNHLIAAIAPQAGLNTINIKFQGLVWANYLSELGWQMFLLLGVFTLVKNRAGCVSDRV